MEPLRGFTRTYHNPISIEDKRSSVIIQGGKGTQLARNGCLTRVPSCQSTTSVYKSSNKISPFIAHRPNYLPTYKYRSQCANALQIYVNHNGYEIVKMLTRFSLPVHVFVEIGGVLSVWTYEIAMPD